MQSYGDLWSRIGGGVNLQIFGRPESGEMGFLKKGHGSHQWRRFRYTVIYAGFVFTRSTIFFTAARYS